MISMAFPHPCLASGWATKWATTAPQRFPKTNLSAGSWIDYRMAMFNVRGDGDQKFRLS